MLIQAFLCMGANRKIEYSVEPRSLWVTSVEGETFYTIDGAGHLAKASPRVRGGKVFRVDLSNIQESDFLMFFLTPTEGDEVPSEVRRFLKSGQGTVALE